MKSITQQLADQHAEAVALQETQQAKKLQHTQLKKNLLNMKKKKGKVWRNWMRQIGLDPDETVNSS